GVLAAHLLRGGVQRRAGGVQGGRHGAADAGGAEPADGLGGDEIADAEVGDLADGVWCLVFGVWWEDRASRVRASPPHLPHRFPPVPLFYPTPNPQPPIPLQEDVGGLEVAVDDRRAQAVREGDG